ncbi:MULTISPECIES: vWA domain-containing protein [unclassified Rhodococcus (in: high G+C Gram-positive bacteria)]|uniref:vWA domain-containing protein n=1 Tax=unclassified Rhodococcus (in: high G+C Gram-positive bacteria) TaxID=192944 RepID=UPI0033986952
MTNPTLSLVAALLDRSGSMHSIADDTRGGFDSFIAKEREADGRTVVTLAQFDNRYELVYDNVPIEKVDPLVLEPRGGTALYDAIGRLVSEVGAGLAAIPEDERPGSVTVLVMTDGHENASREWTNAAVRELIERQEAEYSWDFVFLGSNIDAVEVGADLGFQRDKSMTYVSTSVGRTRCACGVGFLHRGPQARARGVGEMGDKEAVRLVIIQSNDSLSCDEALRPSGPIPTQYHFDRRSGLHEISIRSVDRGLVV